MSRASRRGAVSRAASRAFALAPAHDGVFGWRQAWIRGASIFAFFVVATVLIPSWLARAGFLADLPRVAHDSIVTAVWLVMLVLGMWGVRRLQRQKRI
jgi:hypothetical protein